MRKRGPILSRKPYPKRKKKTKRIIIQIPFFWKKELKASVKVSIPCFHPLLPAAAVDEPGGRRSV